MPTLESASLSGCNTSMNKGKKIHFTESELEIVVNEVETRREILSGPLSAGIHMKRTRNESERVCEAVHAVGSEQRAHTQGKKKRSDLKVEVKRMNIFYASLSCRTLGRPLGGAVFEQIP